jgi:hypothetical protein
MRPGFSPSHSYCDNGFFGAAGVETHPLSMKKALLGVLALTILKAPPVPKEVIIETPTLSHIHLNA